VQSIDELLLTIYPETSELDSETRQIFIDIATKQAGCLGDMTAEGIAYLAAHLIAISNIVSGGSGKEIISEKEGDLSRTYAATAVNSAPSDGGLGETTYGRQYLSIRDTQRLTFGHYVF
jgi:hypothetical protein